MTARDSIAQWACLVCLGAFAVIGTLFWTETRKAWQEPIGYNARLASPLAVLTLDLSGVSVIIKSPTPDPTMTQQANVDATETAMMTSPAPSFAPSTEIPDCIPSEAIKGLACVKHEPTVTPSVATIVPTCEPDYETIPTGARCMWTK